LKALTGDKKWLILGLIVGVCLIISAAAYYFWDSIAGEKIVWELTLAGKNNEQRVLSYEEICRLPSQEARGGFFTTVGVVNGPYEVRGVLLQNLCALVGGIDSEDLVAVSATDGYSMVFDCDQLSGDIPTYDPVTLHEVPHEKLMVLLIYEQDGRTLSDNDGRPLRLAVVGSEALLTEGNNWVKWVKKIEVMRLD
jgi:DMSO/TMAO reductase YedYZ molybdopterin-dependent catalytic subunit